MRRHSVVIGTLVAVVALAAGIGAGAAVRAFQDDGTPPEPEVSLNFDGSDDVSAVDDLIGGDVTGDQAPAGKFALLSGGSMSLADLKGRPIVVNFFATWCAPCVKEMPAFESIHQELGEEVAFVGIDVRDSVDATQDLVDKTGVTYEIGRDPSGAIFEAFDAVNMPSTFLVAADGTVVDRHAGSMSADDLRARIQQHLLS